MLVCALLLFACLVEVVLAQRVESVLAAFAKLYPTAQYGVPLQLQGSVLFTQVSQTDTRINVIVNITGNLQPNTNYAVHIDQYGDISDLTAGTQGGPTYIGSGSASILESVPKNHQRSCLKILTFFVAPGCPSNPGAPRREGDLGNFMTNSNGAILRSLVVPSGPSSLYLLGQYSIVGMSVALHSTADDCVTDNTSPILMQGVIGVMNLDNNFAEFENEILAGVAVLMPTPLCSGCSGTVWLTQTQSVPGVTVTAMIRGLPTTPHEINIHQYGDMSTGDESAMGAHYNPNGRPHNLPPAMPRHMGDLGNIQTYDSSGAGN